MPRFKEIKNINVVILRKKINEEITRSDIEELLGINYGEEVRLRILDESNTFLRLDFVLDVDKNAVSCNPLKCVKIWGCRQRVNLCIQYGKNLTQDWLLGGEIFFACTCCAGSENGSGYHIYTGGYQVPPCPTMLCPAKPAACLW